MLFLLPFWMLASILAQPRPPADALHLIVESQFTYASSTQTSTVEYWVGDDKTYQRRGESVVISRNDRGVMWVLDVQKGTYSERPLPASGSRDATSEDIHSAGFNYEPEFVWKVADTKEKSVINGRTCRLTVATGMADFADMTLKLWLRRADRIPLEPRANRWVLSAARFRYSNPGTYATELLARRPKILLMSLEATVEPPIAPTMVHRVVIQKIESAPAPKGIFDIPPGLKKIP